MGDNNNMGDNSTTQSDNVSQSTENLNRLDDIYKKQASVVTSGSISLLERALSMCMTINGGAAIAVFAFWGTLASSRGTITLCFILPLIAYSVGCIKIINSAFECHKAHVAYSQVFINMLVKRNVNKKDEDYQQQLEKFFSELKQKEAECNNSNRKANHYRKKSLECFIIGCILLVASIISVNISA